MYPTCNKLPRFYDLQKLHKQNLPFRPTVSSIGTSTYECAKYLAKILSPLVGKNAHLYKQLKGLCFGDKRFAGWKRRKLRSVDVTALFTSVPVDETLASGHSRQIEHWHHLIWQNVIDNGWYHHASGTVSIMHLHCVPRRVLSTNPWNGDGVPCVSYCLQLVYQWKIMRKGHWRPHLIHHVSRNVTLATHSRITKREYS